MAASTIDIATFRRLQEAAGADFVDKLVDTFLEEAPAMLRELWAAAQIAEEFAHHDSRSRTTVAHAHGGSTATSSR